MEQAKPSAAQPNQRIKIVRPNAPPKDKILVKAVTQTAEGKRYFLRGAAVMETVEMKLQADEIDWDEETGYAEARGNVHFQHFERNEELRADRIEYNLKEETGKFYNVWGSTYPQIDARPGVLMSQNPFIFQGQWAERLKSKYILHNGFITNCKMPRPWWTLSGPKFDIIPGDRAIAHRSVYRLKKIPLFYAPFFYKSLARAPRRSGFLTPNFGNSSRRGKMFGIGYYWAINRSYDVTYHFQEFTERGTAHHVEARGKPRPGTEFFGIFYGVDDKGLKMEDGTRVKQGGFSVYGTGQSDLGHGFVARGMVNYLSSLTFRQAFTESFNEAIFSEVKSVGVVSKYWSSYTLNVIFERMENFQSLDPNDSIIIRKAPEVEFVSRERKISERVLPVWFSFESSMGLERRKQLLFQTRQFLERMNFAPRVSTALRWKDFHLIPSFTLHETHYGERFENGQVTGRDINRFAQQFDVDLVMPSLERTFNTKGWLGEKVKHVIEPRASFRYVTGVLDFSDIIRFDELELLSNTTEAEVSLTNRFYRKRKGLVSEFLTYQVWQRRYFDEDFGGAVVPGMRNIVRSSADLTGYAFLDGPRKYSPIVSALRGSPMTGLGLEWRWDYDPLRGRIVNGSFTADMRVAKYIFSAGHNHSRSDPVLAPSANQVRGLIGYGSQTQRGFNAAFTAVYDYRLGIMQFATTQVTYNTDCCGLSVQYRRFNIGTRNENQFRVAFAIANIGSFGTMKRQERLF